LRLALAALALLWFTGARGAEVRVEELPSEARATLALIKSGGPFPYPQDGRIFSNREKLLPIQARNYYREFTVRTPGVHGVSLPVAAASTTTAPITTAPSGG